MPLSDCLSLLIIPDADMENEVIIASILTDIKEIRRENSEKISGYIAIAGQLGGISENLKNINDYIKTCEANSAAHEKRITGCETNQIVQRKNNNFIAASIAFVISITGIVVDWYHHG